MWAGPGAASAYLSAAFFFFLFFFFLLLLPPLSPALPSTALTDQRGAGGGLGSSAATALALGFSGSLSLSNKRGEDHIFILGRRSLGGNP